MPCFVFLYLDVVPGIHYYDYQQSNMLLGDPIHCGYILQMITTAKYYKILTILSAELKWCLPLAG